MIAYVTQHLSRFVHYTGLGLVAFSLDLSLLYIAQYVLLVPYLFAVPGAFLIATSLHYVAARHFVFSDTARPLAEGYALFIGIMCSNALVITLLVTGLVEHIGVPLFPARIFVGALFGVVSFFLNARYNFKIT